MIISFDNIKQNTKHESWKFTYVLRPFSFMNSNNGPHIILLASVKLEARDRFLTKQKFVGQQCSCSN